jgi:hypothetical protein
MDRQQQLQKDALKGFQENIQPGRISGVMLIFEGTNDTGQTGDLSDLGTAIIKRKGRTLINRPMDVFGEMGNIRAGNNLFSSTEASDFLASVFIPFYALSFEQALNITGDSELNFEWVPAGSSGTVFTTMQVTAYAQRSFRQEFYEYTILGQDQTENGAVTNRTYQLNTQNITEIYLTDPDNIVSSLELRQDGEQRFSIQSWDAYLAGTIYDNSLEVQNFDMIQLETYTKGQPLSAVNNDSVIGLTTTGGGTVPITVCAIRPTGDFFG